MVKPSPWPILTSLSLFALALGFISYFHFLSYGNCYLILGTLCVCSCLAGWFRDIISEATEQGYHTVKVQQNILFGMALFILSETMFFFSLFWAFFHFSLSPSIWVGGVWPPVGIITINPFGIPLLNTALLLLSGFYVTKSHNALGASSVFDSSDDLGYTVALGAAFTYFQYLEYRTCTFSINDGVYGSIFYMLTGFHGFHVLIGVLFLYVCWVSLSYLHFDSGQHVGFTCAIWYWHFVDVVWIFVYLSVYIWGGDSYWLDSLVPSLF